MHSAAGGRHPRTGAWRLRRAVGLVLPVVLLLAACSACSAGSSTQRAAPRGTGSLAGYLISTDDGAGRTITRKFRVYRPAGLSAAPHPVVVIMNETQSNWEPVADANGFVLVTIPNDQHCSSGGSNCQYAPTAVNPDPTSIGARNCGPQGTAVCDDVPFVADVMDAISCAGAPPCQNIDRAQAFAAGSSKGGTMVQALMCDPRTTTRFVGYQVVSDPLISPSATNDQAISPRCAAVLGANPNRAFSAQWVYGEMDPIANRSCPAHRDCLAMGWTDAKNRWTFGAAQLAGDGAFRNRVFGAALKCAPTPTVTQLTGAATERTYAPCAARNAATSWVRVAGMGHGEPGAYAAGFDVDSAAWTFWRAHLPTPGDGADSPTGGSPGGSGRPPNQIGIGPASGSAGGGFASVRVTRPRPGARVHRRNRRTHRRASIRVSGTTTNPGRVKRILLTVRKRRITSTCAWLSPRRRLVRTSCAKPEVLLAKRSRRHWHYRISRRARLPRGRYVLRAYAIMRGGRVGNALSRAASEVTIRVR